MMTTETCAGCGGKGCGLCSGIGRVTVHTFEGLMPRTAAGLAVDNLAAVIGDALGALDYLADYGEGNATPDGEHMAAYARDAIERINGRLAI